MITLPMIETADAARDFAIEWQHTIAEQPMSWGDVAAWQGYFLALGEKFNLIDEFKENGII